jgi:hypothetical protein
MGLERAMPDPGIDHIVRDAECGGDLDGREFP